eukprot:553328-Rhodomonas_salina.1
MQHIGQVIKVSADDLFRGLDEEHTAFIQAVFLREFFISSVFKLYDMGGLQADEVHQLNNFFVEWAESHCPRCNVCKGGFRFIGFDLCPDGHLRFVWMCIACTWHCNSDVLCKGPVPLEEEKDV